MIKFLIIGKFAIICYECNEIDFKVWKAENANGIESLSGWFPTT
jgi:hypothetical protein